MKITSPLYHPLFNLLGQSKAWADLRHLQALCWMVIGLICSGCINLTCWSSYSESRAKFAQSYQRRFSRWLHNSRINAPRLYKPIIQEALADWDGSVISVIEDTTMLWNQYCLVRLSVQYRGRAVVLGWRVLSQSSSSVALKDYQDLLRASAKLLPEGVKVIFLADRGFADTKLMRFVTQSLGWHHRIRLKSNAWIFRRGYGWKQLRDFHLGCGEAWLMQNVKLTKTHEYGLVNLALARDPISGELWYIVSDEPTTLQTFAEYAERFDIEEEFLDEKSNGFQLHKSEIRSVTALSRLCLVVAVAALWLTSQGEQVVAHGMRRRVDCHWFRVNSYLRIGWDWLKAVVHKGWTLFPKMTLNGRADPEPAMASRKQASQKLQGEFTVKSITYMAC